MARVVAMNEMRSMKDNAKTNKPYEEKKDGTFELKTGVLSKEFLISLEKRYVVASEITYTDFDKILNCYSKQK